jgi:hypothetical protein
MRRLLCVLLLGLFAAPAFAAPIPVFDDPKALLEAVYAQIKAGENWETFDQNAAFDDLDSFSTTLHAAFLKADADMKASGDEIGVLDFSPFINGQDAGGMDFAVGEPKVKGERASVAVAVTGYQQQEIRFELVDEGAEGWKVDDIILPGYDGEPEWRLSDYFADPRASY